MGNGQHTCKLMDFSSLFDQRILDRAYGYRDAGMVTDIRQSTDDADLWHAQVAGSLGFYDVDIRIHGGAVMSAACTCPYGQKHSYCKHVGAVLLTIADQQDERLADAALPNDASEAIRWYWNDQFPGANGWKAVDALDEQDWKAVRRVLETALGLPDSQLHLVSLIRANDSYTKRSATSAQRGNQTNANMRLLVPLFHPTDVAQLPHGWFTFLEAAYERLGDREGLRHMYSRYILMARTLPEAVYVQRLRQVSGEHWQEDRDAIVDFASRHSLEISYGGNNPAYERLLREEHLPQAAAIYCRHNANPRVLLNLLDLVAQTDPEWWKDRVCTMLLQPDSEFYRVNNDASVRYVAAWISRIETVFGAEMAHELATQIVCMFPQREWLHTRLLPYCGVTESEQEPETTDEDTDDSDGGNEESNEQEQ